MDLIQYANSHPTITTICYSATVAFTAVILGLICTVFVAYIRNEREAKVTTEEDY